MVGEPFRKQQITSNPIQGTRRWRSRARHFDKTELRAAAPLGPTTSAVRNSWWEHLPHLKARNIEERHCGSAWSTRFSHDHGSRSANAADMWGPPKMWMMQSEKTPPSWWGWYNQWYNQQKASGLQNRSAFLERAWGFCNGRFLQWIWSKNLISGACCCLSSSTSGINIFWIGDRRETRRIKRT